MTGRSFVYDGLPSRIVFGPGARHRIGDEMTRLGRRRALVLSTPQQASLADETRDQLGDLAVGTFTEAAMHTPVAVSERAAAVARELAADCTVAIGGGSTTGLGKAIAFRTGLDQIVLPTTYAGSEVTPILGQSEAGTKTTQRTLAALPEVVIYDVDLTLSLPAGLSVTSALNSMAHAVEAMWAQERNPITTLMARESIQAFMRALPAIVADPGYVAARSEAQYAAWLAGTCLGTVGMALHHKLCHVFGGTFDLPHAETHAVVLPYVMAYNGGCSPDVVAVVEEAVGAPAVPSLRALLRGLGAPTSLRELGLPEAAIEETVTRCLGSHFWNPRPVERNSLSRLVRDAWSGADPGDDGYP